MVFLVEHMEDFLYEWCKFEYIQMLVYLAGTDVQLCFSNCKSIFQYDGKSKE
jgi:ribosome biogenesis SPOUT family RNA methylase Rps3